MKNRHVDTRDATVSDSDDVGMKALREVSDALAKAREFEGLIAGEAWAHRFARDEIAQLEKVIRTEEIWSGQDLRDALWSRFEGRPTFDHVVGFIDGAASVLGRPRTADAPARAGASSTSTPIVKDTGPACPRDRRPRAGDVHRPPHRT